MGSATREALAQSIEVLVGLGDSADLSTATQLLDAGLVIDASASLSALIADPAAEPDVKASVVERVFTGRVGEPAVRVLASAARGRWSSVSDFVAGVEELGIRAAAISAGDTGAIESEFFQFSRLVAGEPELELALNAKLGAPESKSALVERLLAGKASEQTVAVVSRLVRQPRGRRVRSLLEDAARIVADQRGLTLATVTSAVPLSDEHLSRLRGVLAGTFGKDVTVNLVVDPSLVGGLRVQAGDTVIDGSISSRLADLKLKLAG